MKFFNKLKMTLRLLVCGIVVLSIVVGVVVYSLPIVDNNEALLSSISQGLAAILALVFAIAIFGAQMMQRFTAMDVIIDKWTKRLMILFAVGILLPLIQLETDYDIFNDLLHWNFYKTANLSLAIDLSIATVCVFAVIPYLIKVNRAIKYQGGVSKLSEETAEAIDSDRMATVLNRISELVKLGENAADDMLEFETTTIINKLKNIGEGVADKGWVNATLETITGLRKIGLKASDKELGNVIINTVYALKELGLKCVEKRLDGDPCSMGVGVIPTLDFVFEQHLSSTENKNVAKILGRPDFSRLGMGRILSLMQTVLMALGEIGISEIDVIKLKKHPIVDFVPSSTIDKLKEIAIKAIDIGISDDTVVLSSFGLFRIGVKATKERLSIRSVIINLEEIANSAYEKDIIEFKITYESSLVYLWILGAFVNKYSPQYSKDMASQIKKSNKKVIKDLFGNEDIRTKAREYILMSRESIKNNRHLINGSSKLIDELEAFNDPKLIDELKVFKTLYNAE